MWNKVLECSLWAVVYPFKQIIHIAIANEAENPHASFECHK
ncbi:MAG: hypothetical protein V7L21_21930 [Nostoc sp.]